jgi:hypothetical protein
MTTLLPIENITIDISAIASNGSRWHGRVFFACQGATVAGTWVGDDRSEDGRLVDVEGEDEALCARIDALTDQIERAVSAALGNPREEDATGLGAAMAAVEQERAWSRARAAEKQEALADTVWLTESCLLHARYHGFLPMHVDVPAVVRGLSRSVEAWTQQERLEAYAWRERMRPVGTDPAPPHVQALIERAQRPIRTEAA